MLGEPVEVVVLGGREVGEGGGGGAGLLDGERKMAQAGESSLRRVRVCTFAVAAKFPVLSVMRMRLSEGADMTQRNKQRSGPVFEVRSAWRLASGDVLR